MWTKKCFAVISHTSRPLRLSLSARFCVFLCGWPHHLAYGIIYSLVFIDSLHILITVYQVYIIHIWYQIMISFWRQVVQLGDGRAAVSTLKAGCQGAWWKGTFWLPGDGCWKNRLGKKSELLHLKIAVTLVHIQSFPNRFVRTARPADSILFSTSTIDELAGGLLQARTMLLSRMPVLSVLHNSIAPHHVPTRCHCLLSKHRFKRMNRKDMPDSALQWFTRLSIGLFISGLDLSIHHACSMAWSCSIPIAKPGITQK